MGRGRADRRLRGDVGVFAMLAYVVAAAAVFVWDITCRVMALLRDRTRGAARRDATRGMP
jgi:hypothetical protein